MRARSTVHATQRAEEGVAAVAGRSLNFRRGHKRYGDERLDIRVWIDSQTECDHEFGYFILNTPVLRPSRSGKGSGR